VNTNDSGIFGVGSKGSSIRVVFSRDGGASWSVATIAPTTTADVQHVHPALAMSENGGSGHVAYYVQQADARLRVDQASLRFAGNAIRLAGVAPLSTRSFDLTPSNVPRTATTTTNYDRTIVSCYDIGEYLSVKGDDDGNTLAAWGDNRNTWTGPVGPTPATTSAAPFTHAQPDVFFGLLGD
jgi:hypothetical protein